jgi:hypothetical protein
MGIIIHRFHILKHVTPVESCRVILMDSKSRRPGAGSFCKIRINSNVPKIDLESDRFDISL